MSRHEYEPAGEGYIQYSDQDVKIPVHLFGQGRATEHDTPAIEAPPAEITARIQPVDLREHFSAEKPWNTLLEFYFTGAGKYTALTPSIDYEIRAIVQETVPGEGSPYWQRWDSRTLDKIIEADSIEQLPEEQREFKLLWDLRVASAKLGLSYLKTLALPEGAQRRLIKPLERDIGEKGPHSISPWASQRASTAHDEVLDAFRPDKEDNIPQSDDLEAKKLFQLQIVRFSRTFNALAAYYAQPPEKFSRHLDPTYDRNACFEIDGQWYAPNIDFKPGEYWRTNLLLDIVKRFHLWDQWDQIHKDLGSPEDHH